MKNILVLVLSSFVLLGCQTQPTQTDSEPGGAEHGFLPPPLWNETMENLKQDMTNLEPYIFNKNKFNAIENEPYLKKQIHQLAAEAKNIKHDPMNLTKDPTLRFVATQFSDELAKADENFLAGWREYSRWQLAHVTSFCLECHTRTSEGVSFNPNESAQTYLSQLKTSEQIEFMIAYRQFESAYELISKKLSEPVTSLKVDDESDRIARLGLLVAVQFMQNKAKATQLSDVIAKNLSLPTYLKKSNQLWKKSLAIWNSNERLDTLPQVRNLKQKRLSEIEDMRAIPALLKIVSVGLNQDELGETLLLLGESYESLHHFSMMSLHENYYESCVRKVPKTKWGKICFNKLADSVKLSYTGSGGTRIPQDVNNHIEALKKLIE